MGLAALSSDVPGLFTVAINGVPYPVDPAGFRRVSLPMLAFRLDNIGEPRENTQSPLDLWRRTQDDWSFGAGQDFLDGVQGQTNTSRSRYLSSKGVDPWTEGAVTLLNDTSRFFNAVNSNVKGLVVGSRYYLADGGSLWFTTDLINWTGVTGMPGSTITDIASDGFTVYIAFGITSFIHSTNTGTSAASAWTATHSATKIAWVKGRLISTYTNRVQNLTSPTTATELTPTFLTTPTGWTWNCISESRGHIFVGGGVGDYSVIYRTSIATDGTTLLPMSIAGRLPSGEMVQSMTFYQNVTVLGTSAGVRFSFATNGDVVPGPLIPTTSPVLCLEGQDRFVYFGMTNYDGTSTGLGRCDLGQFTLPLKPAYASDLMATAQGPVTSVSTFLGKRVFTVQVASALGGAYKELTNKVSSGVITSSAVTLGVADIKFFRFLELRHKPMPAGASVAFTVSVDGGTPTVSQQSAVAASSGTSVPFPLADVSGSSLTGDAATIITTLSRATDPTVAPTLTRFSLRATPNPRRGEAIYVPLILRERVKGNNDTDQYLNPRTTFNLLKGYELAGIPITLQVGADRLECIIDSCEWKPDGFTPDFSSFQGGMMLTLRTFQ